MIIIADTNVLIRALVGDEPNQSPKAVEFLRRASSVVLTLPTLCEVAWSLRQRYRLSSAELFDTITGILSDQKVVCDRAAAEAGLAMLVAGGDFADGIIAFEGRRLGGDIFVTFDKKAARLIAETGGRVELL
ncbi:type II toxin-antitoxin system VapC family toxin [Aurantimonas marina]|uniref:type II toxin-antitoxin system VapC family toxin n=1 Tax=Aurantimonas marina TaxID=2780508 RepID=UPI002FCD6BB4